MPLPGGPSDKAGNSYERRWTVFALIDLLEGQAETLRIEVPGDEGVGAEFRLTVNGVPEWHQAKRQQAAGPWTVNALSTEGVLTAWEVKVLGNERFVFVSNTGADELRESADRARSAQTWDEFDKEFLAAESVRTNFQRLQRAWPNLSERDAYAALRRVRVRSIGEADLSDWLKDRLRPLVTSQVHTVAAVLAQLADDSDHSELAASDVWTYLAEHGITPRDLSQDALVVRYVAENPAAYLGRLQPLYIGGQDLHRAEADVAMGCLDEGKRTVIVGGAGAGKSVVAAQVVTTAQRRQWPVSVISADRLPDVATTIQLGESLGRVHSDNEHGVLLGRWVGMPAADSPYAGLDADPVSSHADGQEPGDEPLRSKPTRRRQGILEAHHRAPHTLRNGRRAHGDHLLGHYALYDRCTSIGATRRAPPPRL
jgi:hypothetical protein